MCLHPLQCRAMLAHEPRGCPAAGPIAEAMLSGPIIAMFWPAADTVADDTQYDACRATCSIELPEEHLQVPIATRNWDVYWDGGVNTKALFLGLLSS